MPNVEARLKVNGKSYEIVVDLDEALKIKKGSGDINLALQSLNIYHDVKKATVASQKDLKEAFSTLDIYEIARKIIVSGEVQKTKEYRDDEKDKKIKQVLNLILKNATDQHGRPYTEDFLRNAIKEVHHNFDNRPPEQQMQEVLEKLKSIIPIKIEVRKIQLQIPARYTGQVYGIIKEYKQKEEWLANGDLLAILKVPAGLILEFYEKVNAITHGAVQSQEFKD